MIEIKAPKRVPTSIEKPKIFLAGSIEQGKAIEWQKDVVQSLVPYNVMVLNPRRTNWNASWKDGDKNITRQINWELSGINMSDAVFFYFDPNTLSPITLLEFGKCIAWDVKRFIVCPKGYWRRQNVLVTAKWHHERIYDSLDQGIDELVKWCKKH